MRTAAVIAATLLVGANLFQVALALGAPWGRAAWGGQHEGVLPTRLRVGSGVAAVVVYPFMIALVLASAGIVETARVPGSGRVAMWVLTGFFGLGAVMNAVSRSRVERLWSPVVLVIAICCAIIALSL